MYNMCVYSQVKDNCFTLCQACLMKKFDKNCIYVLVRAQTLIITCLYIFEIIWTYHGKLSLVHRQRVSLGNAAQIPIVFYFLALISWEMNFYDSSVLKGYGEKAPQE